LDGPGSMTPGVSPPLKLSLSPVTQKKESAKLRRIYKLKHLQGADSRKGRREEG